MGEQPTKIARNQQAEAKANKAHRLHIDQRAIGANQPGCVARQEISSAPTERRS
jgi:hypothetical protein